MQNKQLNDFEKRFICDILAQHMRDMRLLGVKAFGTIEGILEKLGGEYR